MKHAQRQYAIKRLNEIFKVKENEIVQAYTAAEKAREDVVQPVQHQYPDFSDVIRKLAGMESTVELKADYRAYLTTLSHSYNGYSFYPATFIQEVAKPTNSAAVDSYLNYQQTSAIRHKTQVQDKIDTLKDKLVESTDALILGNEEAAVQALANFQNFEV